jgi:hypothetical protein
MTRRSGWQVLLVVVTSALLGTIMGCGAQPQSKSSHPLPTSDPTLDQVTVKDKPPPK